jgi:hypothetical protein
MCEYRLKFLFANHDGVAVEATFADNKTVAQVKDELLNTHWPEGKVEKTLSTAGIRLLCMGRMLEDSRTLADMKIPKYEHATPVNVSLLPKGKAYSENSAANPNAPKAQGSHPTPAEARPTGNAAAGGGGCCTIS